MTLYELTRKLVARGCPEHPRLYWFTGEVGYPRRGKRNKIECWALGYDEDAKCPEGIEDDDATDLWTAHALRHLDPDLYAKVVARVAELATMRA